MTYRQLAPQAKTVFALEHHGEQPVLQLVWMRLVLAALPDDSAEKVPMNIFLIIVIKKINNRSARG